MDIERFLNSKTWIINNSYVGNLYLYDKNKTRTHVDDLNKYIAFNQLNIKADDVFTGSLMLASLDNIVVINEGSMLIAFLPKIISTYQKQTIEKLNKILQCFDKIFVARINNNENITYDTYENEDETISEVDYLYHMLNTDSKIKKLA